MDRISVGVDGSAASQAALDWALAEAELRGAEFRVVHAWLQPFVGAYPAGAMESFEVLEGAGREVLGTVCDAADARLGRPVHRVLAPGSPVEAMLEAAETSDLVVVGSRGRGGFTAMLLGSVSSALAHHCPCPLVIVPHGRS